MPTSLYFHAFRNVIKREQPRPVSTVGNSSLFEAVSEGFAIDCEDIDVTSEDVALYRENRTRDGYCYVRFCERLVLMLVDGQELSWAKDVSEWCAATAEIVERHVGWQEEEGRGPFWEMLRCLYLGVPLGTTACRKLVEDFDRWDERARNTGNRKFYDYYQMLRECFAFAAIDGVVIFPYAEDV